MPVVGVEVVIKVGGGDVGCSRDGGIGVGIGASSGGGGGNKGRCR